MSHGLSILELSVRVSTFLCVCSCLGVLVFLVVLILCVGDFEFGKACLLLSVSCVDVWNCARFCFIRVRCHMGTWLGFCVCVLVCPVGL